MLRKSPLIGIFLTLVLHCATTRANETGTPPRAPLPPAPPNSPMEEPLPVPNLEEFYQDELIARAQKQYKIQIDPKPEGKIIERVIIVTNDVIDDRDPWPSFLNHLHATTDADIVERELLFKKGERWHKELVEETARNLRGNLFVSMADIQPGKGSAPDRVVALVVTKDLWSLRLNTDFSLVGSTLQYFTLQLTEDNLGGRMKNGALNFNMDLATNTFGEQYRDPRLAGSRVDWTEGTSIILNRGSGVVEGGEALLEFGQPLFSLDTAWAWDLTVDLKKNIARLYSGSNLATITSTATGELIPYTYASRAYRTNASLTRSYGHLLKQDVSFGWKTFVHLFEIPPGFPGLQPATISDYFTNILPRTEDAGMLYLSYHFYRAEFLKLMDINSYGLTEDFRVGPNLAVEARLANPVFGFSSSFAEASASAKWSWAWNDDYLSVGMDGQARYQNGVLIDTSWINERVSAGIRNVSPRWGIFRVFTSLLATRRHNDQDHNIDTMGGGGSLHSAPETLGGEAALRGFPAQFFFGSQIISGNLEFRTEPLRFRTVHAGAVAFYDFGDAFNDPSQFVLHQSVGVGLRFVFPQFDRQVLRLDAGVPLESAPGLSPMSITFKFDQAF